MPRTRYIVSKKVWTFGLLFPSTDAVLGYMFTKIDILWIDEIDEIWNVRWLDIVLHYIVIVPGGKVCIISHLVDRILNMFLENSVPKHEKNNCDEHVPHQKFPPYSSKSIKTFGDFFVHIAEWSFAKTAGILFPIYFITAHVYDGNLTMGRWNYIFK